MNELIVEEIEDDEPTTEDCIKDSSTIKSHDDEGEGKDSKLLFKLWKVKL